MILDASIFNKGKLLIVNANKPNTGDYSELMSIIETHENEFYFKCLGKMGASFINGINEATPDVKWTNLRDGATYQLNGINVKFRGLSEIASHYIWFKYQEKVSQSTSNGELQVQSEQVSNNYLLVDRWNDMIDLIGQNSIISDYVPSLKTFLQAGDYADFNLCELKYINQLM